MKLVTRAKLSDRRTFPEADRMMEARGHIHLLRHYHYSLSKTWIWASVGDEWRIAGELMAVRGG